MDDYPLFDKLNAKDKIMKKRLNKIIDGTSLQPLWS